MRSIRVAGIFVALVVALMLFAQLFALGNVGEGAVQGGGGHHGREEMAPKTEYSLHEDFGGSLSHSADVVGGDGGGGREPGVASRHPQPTRKLVGPVKPSRAPFVPPIAPSPVPRHLGRPERREEPEEEKLPLVETRRETALTLDRELTSEEVSRLLDGRRKPETWSDGQLRTCLAILRAEEEISAGYLSQSHRNGIVSFPRSGNTWTRILFQRLTGIVSGSIYDDKSAPPPLLGQPGTEGVWVIKSHRPTAMFSRVAAGWKAARGPTAATFDRAVHLVRNPFDAVWSLVNLMATKDFTGNVEGGQLVLKEQELVTEYFEAWVKHWRSWTGREAEDMGGTRILRVRYEDLVEEPYEFFVEMLEFLEVPYEEEWLECLVWEGQCSYHKESCRKSQFGDGFQHFRRLKSDWFSMEGIIGIVQPYLTELGYEIVDGEDAELRLLPLSDFSSPYLSP